ncbi:5-histidylcysteine sulfoxide synthase [Bdellovibrionales bacterium]|nr:5-histidylcysteine sulfoxide synthase [Bdellovibrionales bacterium]
MVSMRTVRLDQGAVESKRDEIRDYFLNACELEDRLFELLKSDESFYQRPDPLRHPLVFYYGHTYAFYVNKLYVGKHIKKRVNPAFESTVAIGVDEMSWDDLNQAHYEWPEISDLRSYRAEVKKMVLEFIDSAELTLPIGWDSPFWVIMMGIEHHRIHLETSSVLIRQLDLRWLASSDIWAPCCEKGPAPKNCMVEVPGGRVEIGKRPEHHFFGWDNEYGDHQIELKKFEASQYLVSNGEFQEFMKDGGYSDKRWWSSEGWRWNQFSQNQKPTFWRGSESEGYRLRTLEREIDLPWNWPVETNYFESSAFCEWKSDQCGVRYRLPTEDEWSRLHQNEKVSDVDGWREAAPGNLNLEMFNSSCPVDQFCFNKFYDVIGNVWQWTETPIYPFDGFQVHDIYDDFSVPTFDFQHNLFKGGSWISTGNEATKNARYAFRRHFYQHAGFRYVISENSTDITNNPYETDQLLSQYCEFHYGASYFEVENFPKACIQAVEPYFKQLPSRTRAMDLGCAVGRSTFELARHFDEVVGIDFSARFIEKAQRFSDMGVLRYTLTTEGDLQDFYERTLSELKLEGLSEKIQFMQGDACNLNKKYGKFDFIFAGNLLDRLHSPKSFLNSVGEFLNVNGVLALTSPYTWLEEHTEKSEWIGGFKKDGEDFTTLEGLEHHFQGQFKRIAEPKEVPFVIRETARKYQHTVAQLTLWQKI